MQDIISEIIFLFQRFNWMTVLDLLIVSLIFYFVLRLLRNSQARTLFRGMIFVFVIVMLMTTLIDLPAFSFLLQSILPAMLVSIPIIFAPELRRALEKVGRAGQGRIFFHRLNLPQDRVQQGISAITLAAKHLSSLKHGALIVLQVSDNLQEYIDTGVSMNSYISAELILQIFYPNTPLHDGAIIVINDEVCAASCVLPLSSVGVLNESPDHQMGLRHRAALGITEATDAVAVVVSEETGDISIAHLGKMIREIKPENLESILKPFFLDDERLNQQNDFFSVLRSWLRIEEEEERKK